MTMKFNLANKNEAQSARSRLAYLAGRHSIIEIRRIQPRRTLPQNSYLHLIITAFGNHFGYSLEEAKQIYKELNSAIYCYKKKGRTFWRSSAELSKEEMAASIDNLMRRSADAGYPLPLATDQGWLREIENEIERSRYYI